MAPIYNLNLSPPNKLMLIVGIFSVLLAFVGVVFAVQTRRTHRAIRGRQNAGMFNHETIRLCM
jgi:hypothetical protein